MKKKILKYTLAGIMVLSMGACSDFFNVETDNILDTENYMKEESEMYAGFMGVATKIQAIGDKIVYLTDTRGEMLEPTRNTPDELHNIYNYDTDLKGNSYADPAPYYEVIIACNDYLLKLREYKEAHESSINMTDYEALLSATVRVKAWIYLTLGKIYGEAVWFDDPMREKKDLTLFPVKKLIGGDLIESCIALLEEGFEGIPGDRPFINWATWIDPEETMGSGSSNPYYYWSFIVPEYFVLRAELALWNSEYQMVLDLILAQMNATFKTSTSQSINWMCNDDMVGKWSNFWQRGGGDPHRPQVVSVITYDYTRNQTNSLLKHFGTEIPNEYLLAPSAVGRARFSDPAVDSLGINPLGTATSDPRSRATFGQNSAGDYVIRKYRPDNSVRTYAYQEDVPIYIYRATELYFMLAEALNNLDRFPEVSGMINTGVNGAFPSGKVTWEGFTDDWTAITTIGNRTYPDKGIRGMQKLGPRTFTTDRRENDMEILNEMMLEFSCEGKVYPAMIRMALRHEDFNIIADRVCAKYTNGEEIRAKILAGGYFINWDMTNNK